MDIAEEISQIRKAYVPSQRIKKRSEYEKKARDIIQKNLSTLSWENLYSAISLIDSDFWKEEEIEGRFSPFLASPIKTESVLMTSGKSGSYYTLYL